MASTEEITATVNADAKPYMTALDELKAKTNELSAAVQKNSDKAAKSGKKNADAQKKAELDLLKIKQKSINEGIAAAEKEFKKKLSLTKKGSADRIKIEQDYYKKVEKLQEQSAKNLQKILKRQEKSTKESTGRQRAHMAGQFANLTQSVQSGSIAGIAGAFGPVAGAVGVGIDAIGKMAGALVDLGKEGKRIENSIDILNNSLQFNFGPIGSKRLTEIRIGLEAIQRPAGKSKQEMFEFATAVQEFSGPDGLVKTVDTLYKLERGFKDIDTVKAGQDINRLAQFTGDFESAADLAAATAKSFEAYSINPLEDAINSLVPSMQAANNLIGDNAEAAKQAATVNSALVKANVDVQKAGALTEKLFSGLNKAINDPATIERLERDLPKGFDLMSAGIEKGNIDVVKFVDTVTKAGDAGKQVAAVLGPRLGGEALNFLQTQFEQTGTSIADTAANFDNLEGSVERAAAIMQPLNVQLSELTEQRTEDFGTTFGRNLSQGIEDGQKAFNSLLDGFATADFGIFEGLLDPIRDLFVDSAVEAEKAFQKFEVNLEALRGFQSVIGEIKSETDAGTFLAGVTANLDQIANVAPGAAKRIEDISNNVNMTEAEKMEAVSRALDQIEKSQAAATVEALSEAIRLAEEAVEDVADDTSSWFDSFVSAFEGYADLITGDVASANERFLDSSASAMTNVNQQIAFANQRIADLDKQYEAANGNIAEQVRIAKELENVSNQLITAESQKQKILDQSLIGIENELEARRQMAESSGKVFDEEKALTKILQAKQQSTIAEVGLYDELVQQSKELLGVTGEQARASKEAADVQEDRVMIGQEAMNVVDAELEGTRELGITIAGNTELEIQNLEAKKVQLLAIIEQRKFELQAIKQAIAASAAGVEADNVRLELANKIAKAEEQIAKIKSGEIKQATLIEKVSAGNLEALAREVEADISRFEGAVKDIDSKVAGLKRGGAGGRGGGGRGAADKEAKAREDAAKKAAEEAKKRAEALAKIEEDRISKLKALEEEEEKLRIEKRKVAIQEIFEERAIARQRSEAARELARELKSLGDTLRQDVANRINEGLTRVDDILDRYRNASQLLLKALQGQRAQTEAEITELQSQEREVREAITTGEEELEAFAADLAAATAVYNRANDSVQGFAASIRRQKELIVEAESALEKAKLDAGDSESGQRTALTKAIQDIAAATGQTAAAIAASSTESGKLRTFLSSIGQTSGSGANLTTSITGTSLNISDINADEAQAILDALAERSKLLNESLAGLGSSTNAGVRTAQERLDRLNSRLVDMTNTQELNTEQQTQATSAYEELSTKVQGLNEALDANRLRLAAIRTALGDVDVVAFVGQLNEAVIGVDDVNQRLTEQRDLVKQTLEATDPEEIIRLAREARNVIQPSDLDLVARFSELLSSDELADGYDKLNDEQKDIVDGAKELIKDTESLEDAVTSLVDALDVSALVMQAKWKTAIDEAAGSIAGIVDQIGELERASDKISQREQTIVGLETDRANLARQIERYNELRAAGKELTEDQLRDLARVEDAFVKLSREIETESGRIREAFEADVKAGIDAVLKGLEAFGNAVDTFSGYVETLREGDTRKTAEATIDLTKKVGEALLNAPPPVSIIGAIIVGGSIIAKAIAKLTELFTVPQASRLDLAEQTAETEARITDLLSKQMAILDKMSEFGDYRVDQAREELAARQKAYELTIAESEVIRRMNAYSTEGLIQRTKLLGEQANELGSFVEQIERTLEFGDRSARKSLLQRLGGEDLLRQLGIDTDFGLNTRKALKRILEDVQAAELEINTQLEAGNTILEQRLTILQLSRDIVEEEIGLIQLRMKLGLDEGRALDAIAAKRRELALQALQDLFDAQDRGEIDLGVSLVGGLEGRTDEQLRQLIDALARVPDSQISPELAEIFSAWIDAAEAAEEYANSAGSASEADREAFELAKRLLKLRLDAGKITEEEYREQLLDLLKEELQRRIDINASEMERLEIEAEIFQLMKDQNAESATANKLVVQAIEDYQKLLQRIRQVTSGGTPSADDQASLDAARATIRAELEAAGRTPEEIDKILASLPQFESGGRHRSDGIGVFHEGEFTNTEPAVRMFGLQFFEALNRAARGAGRPSLPVSAAAARTLAPMMNQMSIEVTVNGGLNFTFNTAPGTSAEEILAKARSESTSRFVDEVQAKLRARVLNPNAGQSI